jgi:hypothetical protein
VLGVSCFDCKLSRGASQSKFSAFHDLLSNYGTNKGVKTILTAKKCLWAFDNLKTVRTRGAEPGRWDTIGNGFRPETERFFRLGKNVFAPDNSKVAVSCAALHNHHSALSHP